MTTKKKTAVTATKTAEGGTTVTGASNRETLVDIAKSARSDGEEAAPATESAAPSAADS